MNAKKRLARTIIAGFYSEEAPVQPMRVGRQVHKRGEDGEGLEEIRVTFADL